jgi:hypothetical protein
LGRISTEVPSYVFGDPECGQRLASLPSTIMMIIYEMSHQSSTRNIHRFRSTFAPTRRFRRLYVTSYPRSGCLESTTRIHQLQFELDCGCASLEEHEEIANSVEAEAPNEFEESYEEGSLTSLRHSDSAAKQWKSRKGLQCLCMRIYNPP